MAMEGFGLSIPTPIAFQPYNVDSRWLEALPHLKVHQTSIMTVHETDLGNFAFSLPSQFFERVCLDTMNDSFVYSLFQDEYFTWFKSLLADKRNNSIEISCFVGHEISSVWPKSY